MLQMKSEQSRKLFILGSLLQSFPQLVIIGNIHSHSREGDRDKASEVPRYLAPGNKKGHIGASLYHFMTPDLANRGGKL
jgi:hypothetical protein